MVSYLSATRVSGQWVVSLNPYCSGRWSRTEKFDEFTAHMWVLILIVLEDGLVHAQRAALDAADHGLNPYCSGRWSRTY